jgi:short-subunit dehydrogenase
VSRLRGRVCVVTGASGGIGEATARALAVAGATVVLTARRLDVLEEIVADIRGRGGTAGAVACDVADVDQVRALVDRVEDEHGRCDVLVNNAGVPGGGSFVDAALERLELVARVNFLGVVYCTRLFLPLLQASRGHVVNIASLAGRYALPGAAIYTATKHAVVAFSESLYHELAGDGVMVTVVNPGLVATEGFFPQDSPLWKDPVARRSRGLGTPVAGGAAGLPAAHAAAVPGGDAAGGGEQSAPLRPPATALRSREEGSASPGRDPSPVLEARKNRPHEDQRDEEQANHNRPAHDPCEGLTFPKPAHRLGLVVRHDPQDQGGDARKQAQKAYDGDEETQQEEHDGADASVHRPLRQIILSGSRDTSRRWCLCHVTTLLPLVRSRRL